MPSLDDFNKPAGVEFDGCFECDTCEEIVYKAYGDPNTKELIFRCPEGHRTVIKEWKVW